MLAEKEPDIFCESGPVHGGQNVHHEGGFCCDKGGYGAVEDSVESLAHGISPKRAYEKSTTSFAVCQVRS